MTTSTKTLPGPDAAAAPKLFRVTYVDTTIRETFISACNADEASDILESEIADGRHHHAIDAYLDDVQAQQVTTTPRRRLCFESSALGN